MYQPRRNRDLTLEPIKGFYNRLASCLSSRKYKKGYSVPIWTALKKSGNEDGVKGTTEVEAAPSSKVNRIEEPSANFAGSVSGPISDERRRRRRRLNEEKEEKKLSVTRPVHKSQEFLLRAATLQSDKFARMYGNCLEALTGLLNDEKPTPVESKRARIRKLAEESKETKGKGKKKAKRVAPNRLRALAARRREQDEKERTLLELSLAAKQKATVIPEGGSQKVQKAKKTKTQGKAVAVAAFGYDMDLVSSAASTIRPLVEFCTPANKSAMVGKKADQFCFSAQRRAKLRAFRSRESAARLIIIKASIDLIAKDGSTSEPVPSILSKEEVDKWLMEEKTNSSIKKKKK
jgi:hypothetical protein